MTHYKAVIFDLDGTLLNTIDDIADSMNEALANHGLKSYSVENYKYFVGNGVDELVQNVLKNQQANGSLFESVKAAYLATYSHKQHDKTKPYPGIEKLLAGLIQANISINVLSNKPDHDTQTVIQHFFPKTAFNFVYGKKPGYPIKPDPCSVNEIIGKLGFSRSEILYVGDTFTDMMTAKNADLTSVGVLWGFRKVEELKRGGAHFIIEIPEALLGLVKEGTIHANLA